MTGHEITKLDAARRQLDTPIRLFFDNEDSLSIHTLAYASFKILFDIYPLHKSDDFATKIDEMIRVMGWQRFNETAKRCRRIGLKNSKSFLNHLREQP